MRMTTTSLDIEEQRISALNPQGALPEIPTPEDYKEEQMEFSMDIEVDSKKQFIVLQGDNRGVHEHVPEALVVKQQEPSNTSTESEFLLATQLENDSIDSLEEPLTISEPISMPAALCDDLLLQEINAIPDKMGFKIGDVADLLDIKQYVLRYWESEFDILKPKKANNNQRLYTKKDVENAFLIRKLLHRDRFSIEGARSALKGLKAYVKKENQKEKEIKQAFHKIESYQERLENIAFDIRRIRQLFK